MEQLAVPRIIISGVTPSVGKSLLVIGLATELKQRGISVSCCVIGPNLQQAVLLKGITDRYVHVLDPKLQSQSQMLESLYMAGLGADVVLIEGMSTLLEPIQGGDFVGGPDSYIAKITYTPICPVFDISLNETEAVNNLLLHSKLLPEINITAAIANRLPSEQSELLKAITSINNELIANGKDPLLGVVPQIVNPEDLPSHGIHQTSKLPPISRQFLMELSSIVARCVDVDELLSNAAKAQTIILDDYRYIPATRGCRIAVSFDNAFGLCFQDNLSFLRLYGADIVPFSILADTSLPKGIGGLYITGGFLSEYSTDLLKNKSMIRSIRTFNEQGGAIYAEGAGAAYLCRDFALPDKNTRSSGLGLIPADAAPGDGMEWYFKGTIMEDSVLGGNDSPIHGISTGEWQIKNPERMMRCLRMIRSNAGTVMEGFSPTGQFFGTFSFLHWGTNPLVAKKFVEASSVISFSK